MFGSFLSCLIHHLVDFDALIWIGFWVIQRIAIDSLCKPFPEIYSHFHNYFIFNLFKYFARKTSTRLQKLQKFEYLNDKKNHFRWRKKHFPEQALSPVSHKKQTTYKKHEKWTKILLELNFFEVGIKNFFYQGWKCSGFWQNTGLPLCLYSFSNLSIKP